MFIILHMQYYYYIIIIILFSDPVLFNTVKA